MNNPVKSKINYTALLSAFLGTAITAGWIPEAYEEDLTTILLIGGPALVVFFRTFWTNEGALVKRAINKWIG